LAFRAAHVLSKVLENIVVLEKIEGPSGTHVTGEINGVIFYRARLRALRRTAKLEQRFSMWGFLEGVPGDPQQLND